MTPSNCQSVTTWLLFEIRHFDGIFPFADDPHNYIVSCFCCIVMSICPIQKHTFVGFKQTQNDRFFQHVKHHITWFVCSI